MFLGCSQVVTRSLKSVFENGCSRPSTRTQWHITNSARFAHLTVWTIKRPSKPYDGAQQHSGRSYQQRWYSQNVSSPEKQHEAGQNSSAADRANKLSPILEQLPGPVNFAVAYGSGVMKQANADANSPAPMIDLILSAPSPIEFHKSNLERNPTHYPFHARAFGASWVVWLQESFGAGAWYIPMVKIANMDIKYGIVSNSTLVRDLTQWDTLYFAGRLHKPTVMLKIENTDQALASALESNDKAALAVALLLLPHSEPFTEYQLWEQIAGISYAGDPRMAIPGAENPAKVKNIVRGPGALEGFREKYGKYLDEMGVAWVDNEKPSAIGSSGSWPSEGEQNLHYTGKVSDRATLISHLPRSLQEKLAMEYGPYRVSLLESAQDPDPGSQNAAWKEIIETYDLGPNILNAIRDISRWPATTQSMKGLLTAGLRKSLSYSLAKMRKSVSGKKHANS